MTSRLTLNRYGVVALAGAALLLAALPLALTAQQAEPTYDLRGPDPVKGRVTRDWSKITMKEGVIVIKAGGEKLEGKISMVGEAEEEVEILAVEGRQATKVRTKKVKDETKTTTEIGGEKDTQTEEDDLVGETIISERVKDGWKNTLQGGKPTEEQAKALKDFVGPESDDPIYPAKKVGIGAQWDIDGSALRKVFGSSRVTDLSGKGKGKFVAVEKVNGDPCAVIHMETDLKCKMPIDDNEMTVELNGKAVISRSLKLGQDVKYKFEGKAKFFGDVEEAGQKISMEFSGPCTLEGTTSVK
jgi:hypothetical protein